MKKFKKTLAIILAVIMVVAVAPVSAFAKTEVDEIEVYFDELCGYDVDDWYGYGYIFTDGIYFDDMNGDPAVFAYDKDGEPVYFFESNTTYELYIYFVADESEGYYLTDSETIPVYFNGEEYEGTIDYFYDTYYGVELYVEYTTADWGDEVIDYVALELYPSVNNKIGDWEDYITFYSSNVDFDDENGFPGVYVFDSFTGEQIDERKYFEDDRAYDIYVQVAPNEGYYFAINDLYTEINYQEADDFYVSSYYDDDDGLIQYAEVSEYEFYVDGMSTIIQKIHNFIIDIFIRIEEFFFFF